MNESLPSPVTVQNEVLSANEKAMQRTPLLMRKRTTHRFPFRSVDG